MPAIIVENLVRTYQVYRKREGLRASLRGLLRRDYKRSGRGQ